jgi:hypothetical protein
MEAHDESHHEPAPTSTARNLPEGSGGEHQLSIEQRIRFVQWHLNRYDLLRGSTASRAGAVLSAGAILSAGNAVILSQILTGSPSTLRPWSQVLTSVATLISMTLIVLSLFHASNVLVTRRSSRRMFDRNGNLPVSMLFNGTDTVEHITSFTDFSAVVRQQSYGEMLAAAEVELWIGMKQHRQRYVELRRAVRDLRYAALAFVLILGEVILANLRVPV